MKSPLLIGTDLDKLSADNVAVLKNKYLLAFNQDDVFGAPAKPYKWGTNPDFTFDKDHPAEFFSGKFKQGTLVLALNNTPNRATKQIPFDEVPGLSSKNAYRVTEGWTGADWGCVKGGLAVSLNTHDTAVLVIGDKCSTSQSDGFIAQEFRA
jgi:alpha-galactosidase